MSQPCQQWLFSQGMCDLAAPLLVLIDDECLVYSCFVKLMQRITFQKGNEMDIRLDNLRSLIQVSFVFGQLELRDNSSTARWYQLLIAVYRAILLEKKSFLIRRKNLPATRLIETVCSVQHR